MLTTSPFEPELFARRGAVGLLVPGRGATVDRDEVRDLLELATLPTSRCARPCPIEIFVELPPAGEHHNVRRYSIAIVGGGYRGLLTSKGTRIDGLVFAADVPETVRALETGEEPTIGWREEDDAPASLRRLDERLSDAHDARGWSNLAVAVALVTFGAVALARRSSTAGRAALLTAPVALSGALLLSALDLRSALLLATSTGFGAAAAALATARRHALAAALLAFLIVELTVLVAWPEVNSLAPIGPHPDGGGRFYGITNQVHTLLLAPALACAALAGPRWLLAVGALALVTVGWSRAGADGGGAIVVVVAFAVLALRLRDRPLTARTLAAVGAAAVAVALVLVALDAALGGSDHVTRTVGDGPVELVRELGHRLEVSWSGATATPARILAFAAGAGGLLFLATRRPRIPTLDALLVALAASLLVNDTPTDVAGFGALSGFGLWAWERVGGRRGRPLD